MKRLFVGCRVRLTWARKQLHLPGRLYAKAGDEGRICEKAENLSGDDWCVDWGGFFTTVLSDQLEPIQDPGHQVVSWDACLWQPEGAPA